MTKETASPGMSGGCWEWWRSGGWEQWWGGMGGAACGPCRVSDQSWWPGWSCRCLQWHESETRSEDAMKTTWLETCQGWHLAEPSLREHSRHCIIVFLISSVINWLSNKILWLQSQRMNLVSLQLGPSNTDSLSFFIFRQKQFTFWLFHAMLVCKCFHEILQLSFKQ